MVIVEREAFPHLPSGISDNGVGIGVVVGRPMKDFDTQGAFLQQVAMPR
jgi:hypothetical protein